MKKKPLFWKMSSNRKGKSAARREPSWAVSLVPFAVLTLSLVVVIKIFGADALSGGSQVCLLLASAVTAAISMASALQAAPDAAFLLHSGDFVSAGRGEEGWQDLLFQRLKITAGQSRGQGRA